MSVSIAQDAIALLIDLAEKGEIDPWDVKVIEVIDRYLMELAPRLEAGTDRMDLSRSGQAFLYASMLVLLKADNLVRAETLADEPEAPEEEFLEIEDFALAYALPLKLERQLRRRAVAPPQRKRPVTLPELIEQLELMATAIAEPVPRTRSRRLRQSNADAARDITELAHQENLTENAADLDRFIAQHWDELACGEEWIEFERILGVWQPEDPGHHPSPTSRQVALFWALLLLSSQSKVELQQDEFYQTLRIRPIDPSPIDPSLIVEVI
jgi:segregation and condensation protein A